MGSGPPVQISRDGGAEADLVARRAHDLLSRGTHDVRRDRLRVAAFGRRRRGRVFAGVYLTDGGSTNYDLSPDGKHFLMLQSVDRQAETILVYNWAANCGRAGGSSSLRRPAAPGGRALAEPDGRADELAHDRDRV